MSAIGLRARVARLSIWVLTLGTIGTGLQLLLTRTVVLWEQVPGSDDTWEASPIDVTGIGLALLCTGVLCAVIVLACEGYLWPPGKSIGMAGPPAEKTRLKLAAKQRWEN